MTSHRQFFTRLILVPLVVQALAGAITPAKSEGIRVAESDMCPVAKANAKQCYQNQQSMGGGSDGQAGAFAQCVKVYCQAMTAGGCSDPPSFCP